MGQGGFSKTVKIGGFDHVRAVCIGGTNPLVIQTMWKEPLGFSDLEGEAGEALVARIQGLHDMGCGILRFAVPDIASADVLGKLASMVPMPLCADIHFDYKIALRCLDFPIAKIRINPGNIGERSRVEAVLSKAAEKKRPVRIGVNAGSLPAEFRKKAGDAMDTAEALVRAAERELAICREFAFSDVLVSMKASNIADTIKANRMLSTRTDAPLHIGLTEAGPLVPGTVRNTAALLSLLGQGIGDTVRVSLSDTMENEVIAAREILGAAASVSQVNAAEAECAAADAPPASDAPAEFAPARIAQAKVAQRLVQRGVRIVSCPRCGRCGFDTHAFTGRWMHRLYSLDKDISVAIMGCEVNGPVEAQHADLGITGSGNAVLIFRRGKIVRRIDAADADAAFAEELEKF